MRALAVSRKETASTVEARPSLLSPHPPRSPVVLPTSSWCMVRQFDTWTCPFMTVVASELDCAPSFFVESIFMLTECSMHHGVTCFVDTQC